MKSKKVTRALRERIRAEGRRLIAEGRGLIVTRRLLCGAFNIRTRDFDRMLSGRDPATGSCPVFQSHVDLVIALENFFDDTTKSRGGQAKCR